MNGAAVHACLCNPASLDWQTAAVCRGADGFIPDLRPGEPFWPLVEPLARDYCAVCPVLAECGRYADTTRSVGVWGGTYRRRRGSRYERAALIDAAALTPLHGRVAS